MYGEAVEDLVHGLHMHVSFIKWRWALYFLFIADMDLCAKYRMQNAGIICNIVVSLFHLTTLVWFLPVSMGIKQTFVVVIDGAIINSTMQLIMLQANEKHCITRKYHVPPHRP